VLLPAIVGLAGCTTLFYTGVNPNSHYVYPNSNVKPLGQIKSETDEWGVNLLGIQLKGSPFCHVSAEMQEQALNDAIRKGNGDLLINYVEYQRMLLIPLPYVMVTKSTYGVEGTAAKMDVGMQELN
jgi:hypothetical protein